MRRLFAAGPFAIGASVALEDAEARHLKVLRLREGDPVELFDGEGGLASGRLDARASVIVKSVSSAPVPAPLVLIQALAKGDKLDTVIRMGTEIGVTRFLLVETERTVPSPDAKRLSRWQRIAREAARQSEQPFTPSITGPMPLLAAAREAPITADRRLLAARGTLGSHAGATSDGHWLVIGPEGGLTEAEEQTLEQLGYRRWTLPTGILRTETAAAVALGAILGSGPRS